VYDFHKFETIVELLMFLVDHPAASWDKGELAALRVDIECGEYETPLQDVIAMGLQSKEGFDPRQLEKLDTLISLMRLEDSPWVIKLREYERGKKISPNDDHE
jgi:hypothetical protein